MTQHTRSAILQTFGEMLERIPFDKITVTALIRQCGISRNTFYYHYVDIYDLLDEWLRRELVKYENLSDRNGWRDSVKALLHNCRANKNRVYHLFNSLSRDRLERYVFTSADDMIATYVSALPEAAGASPRRVESVAEFCRYAVVGFMLRFLWSGMTDDIDASVDEMAPLIERAARSGLRGDP